MLVRSKEMVFIKGKRLRVDPVTGLTEAFEVTIKEDRPFPKHLVAAEGAAKVERVVKSLKQRIIRQHLLEFLMQLQRRELQETDRLLQLRRQRKML